MFPFNINWGKLTEWRFWFRTRPLPFYPSTLNFLLFLFAGFIVIAIFFKILNKKDKDILRRRVWRKLWTCFLTIGIVGEILNFFAWSRAVYLGMRFWYLVLLVVFVVWLVLIIIYAVKKLPKQRQEFKRKDEFEKYLPK